MNIIICKTAKWKALQYYVNWDCRETLLLLYIWFARACPKFCIFALCDPLGPALSFVYYSALRPPRACTKLRKNNLFSYLNSHDNVWGNLSNERRPFPYSPIATYYWNMVVWLVIHKKTLEYFTSQVDFGFCYLWNKIFTKETFR